MGDLLRMSGSSPSFKFSTSPYPMNYFFQPCIFFNPFLNTKTGFCDGRWPYSEKRTYLSILFAAVSVALKEGALQPLL